MRKLIATLVVLSLLAGVAAVSALGATKSVAWKDPVSKTIKVRKGTKVKWVWADGLPHNVKGKGFKSKIVSGKGKSYSHTFKTKGKFKVICQVHPTTMKTIVKVF
jgi:plastocyanin